MVLSAEYWDCECERDYIHHNSVDECQNSVHGVRMRLGKDCNIKIQSWYRM